MGFMSLIVSVSLLWSSGLQAYQQKTPGAPPGTVLISCSVQDKKGRVVDDLEVEDFEVYEDGALQEITYFSSDLGTSSPARRKFGP